MPFRILQTYWYWDTQTGEYNHRIHYPTLAMQEDPQYDVLNINISHPYFPFLVLEADILILHLMYQPELEQIIELRQALNKKTIYEIPDNFLDPVPWMDENDPHRNPFVRQNFLHYASICDGLQLSSPRLAEVFGHINKNTAVLENQIKSYPEPPTREDGFVIGWGGSAGHDEDLAHFASTIVAFACENPDVIFSYMGPRVLYDKHFHAIPETQRRFTPPGPIDAYFQFIRTLHVGFAPLIDTQFNLGRSDGKFLEYAAHWAAPLLSDVPVYRPHGEHALLFKDPEELAQRLRQMHAAPDLVQEIAARAHAYVTEHRSPDAYRKGREAFWTNLLPTAPTPETFEDISGYQQEMALLKQGISYFWSKEYNSALQTFSKALQLCSDYYMAHIWIMKTLLETGQYQQLMDLYGQLKPIPIYKDLWCECLYRATAKLGAPQAAHYLQQISSPTRKLHLTVPQDMGQEELFEKILAYKPYDYTALTGLLKIRKRKSPQDPYTFALAERACFIHPESKTLNKIRKNLEKYQL